MDNRKIITVISTAFLSLSLFSLSNKVTADSKTEAVQETTSYSLMTKIGGNKNYPVWKQIKNGKPSGKVANGIDFKYSHLQSTQKIKTKSATYWLLYVDGRRIGWVNQNYFARNQISVAKEVSLVNNPNYSFNPKDAINYATDSTGTVVDDSQVSVSTDAVNSGSAGTQKVRYSYGKAKATLKVEVRKDPNEGVISTSSIKPKAGTTSLHSWNQHYGASLNYLTWRVYKPETQNHYWSINGLNFSTRFYQPMALSVKTNSNLEGNINRVGYVPEGITLSGGWFYSVLLSHLNLIKGHVVGYNLNKIKSHFSAQYLLTMKQKTFNSYIKNIKVSPYVPIGHGQAVGSSKNYIYLLVGDDSNSHAGNSEEIVQLRKNDLAVNKIWTIKAWGDNAQGARFARNGTFIGDNTLYVPYYYSSQKRWEFWEFKRNGNTWTPHVVGAISNNFTTKSAPAQGFAYDSRHQNFYLAYNDVFVKLGRNGTYKKAYSFHTGREIEGMSVNGNRLYINLAQRPELIESNQLSN